MEGVIKDKLAFEGDEGEFHFVTHYLSHPKGEALVEISTAERTVRKFLFPAYKIWNIAAHAKDIVAGLRMENDSGLYIAGDTGFGGNVYS